MFNWESLAILFASLFIIWLLINLYLGGPKLNAYDRPIPNSRATKRERASPENQEALRILEQAAAEMSSPPLGQRLEAIRRFMERGFCAPHLLEQDIGYRIQELDMNGMAAEWVLAPHSDADKRLLYLHGGAFISGCPRGHRAITTEIARVTGAAVLAIDYRLMPEHTRRELIEDCQAAYLWILDNGPQGAAPLRELFIAGDSAGGGLTLTLIAWARDNGLRAADGAIAISPSVDMTISSPTFKENKDTDYMLGPKLGLLLKIPRSLRLLLTWASNRMLPPNPLVSPVFGDLSGLPPVLIQASESEMMLGDAQRYVNKALVAGTAAELETWPEMLHVWHFFAPILPEAQEALERISAFVERCRALKSV